MFLLQSHRLLKLLAISTKQVFTKSKMLLTFNLDTLGFKMNLEYNQGQKMYKRVTYTEQMNNLQFSPGA